jgi:hypothetical protein
MTSSAADGGHSNHAPAAALDAMLAAVSRLAPSVKPAVVFGNLAELCVPAFSDACAIDITELGSDAHRVWHPHAPRGVRRPFDPAPVLTGRPTPSLLCIPFESPPHDPGSAYHGVFAYIRHAREFRPGMAAIAGLLVDRAVATVTQQRLADAHSQLIDQAANLQVALLTSRQIGAAIGILMAAHRVTEDAAFGMLRRASQGSHRKLRDVAEDVIDTGWLDPDLNDSAPRIYDPGGRARTPQADH